MASETNQYCVHRKKIVKNPYLPEDVIENILSFLSLKELSSLSILSKRFKFSWKCCRDLSFGRDFARHLSREEYKTTLNNFFTNYSFDSAEKFKLLFDATAEAPLVSSWISKAVALKVKEIELDFSPSHKKFTLSYDLINGDAIRVLKLVNCDLRLPFESNGLRNVREITFQDVRARPGLIHAIFQNCANLRILKLVKCSSVKSLMASGTELKILVVKNCTDVDSVIINAQSLSTFHYHGKITEFNFYCHLPRLNDVVLDIDHPRTFQILNCRDEMMNRLASVETLTASSIFLEGLTTRFRENEYSDMAFSLFNLKEFQLIVAPESFVNPSDVAIFLRKCPQIETIFINLGKNAFVSSFYWETHGKNFLKECHTIIPYLKNVKIKGFTMKELPVVMAKYFLKNAINLTSLVVVKARKHYFPVSYNSEWLNMGILTNATVHIYDYNRDRSSLVPKHLGHV